MDDIRIETYERIRKAVSSSVNVPARPVSNEAKLTKARAALPNPSAKDYLSEKGYPDTLDHLINDIAPALNGQNRTATYWGGSATGGTLTIAEIAENLVSAFDQDVSTHLPRESIATEAEDAALVMLIDFFHLGKPEEWEGRIFTTGAVAGNVLGIACGREKVIQARLPENSESVADLGILEACMKAGVKKIQILADGGHSSLAKAASIVGLGRNAVKVLPYSETEPWRLDIKAVEKELQREGVASIIAVSFGDSMTGRFATTGISDMKKLRELATKHNAWLHVDGALGIYTRALPADKEFARLKEYAAGLELADSITAELHSVLNVPYDTGVFYTRKASTLYAVCNNAGERSLSLADGSVQSPRNIGIENSRRFRALPVYAVLLCEGRDRLSQMLARLVRSTRAIAKIIAFEQGYVLLPGDSTLGKIRALVSDMHDIHFTVLFRATDDSLNDKLADEINNDGVWYVGRTTWEGKPALRIAVASWRINEKVDPGSVGYYLGVYSMEHKHGPWRR
ncbi:unnamed protein product [Clonostachys solani]|uniref:Uncharacterized protein n=1 Tax=Clonostachys solani TaxID=160281 RepID=A0A9N9ZFA9_9HYPO|nr:unnamed protein product [Clonostachys solani]